VVERRRRRRRRRREREGGGETGGSGKGGTARVGVHVCLRGCVCIEYTNVHSIIRKRARAAVRRCRDRRGVGVDKQIAVFSRVGVVYAHK